MEVCQEMKPDAFPSFLTYMPSTKRCFLQSNAIFTWVCAVIVLSVGQIAAQRQEPAAVQVVEEDFHSTVEKMSFSDSMKIDAVLSKIPAKAAPDMILDVRHAWLLLNKRLVEEKVDMKVVLQTNMHPLKADTLFLARPIKSVFQHKLTGKPLREAFEKMSCQDLLDVIAENADLHALYRKGVIVLCNYIHE